MTITLNQRKERGSGSAADISGSTLRVCRWPLIFAICVAALSGISTQDADAIGADLPELMRQIGEAQRKSDEQKVIALTAEAKKALGARAGTPDREPRIRSVPQDVPNITRREITVGFDPYKREILRRKWWRIGEDPTKSERPLRDIASVVTGCAFAARAASEKSDELLDIANSGADYLLWAQQQGGKGLFPFPARRGGKQRAFIVSERFIQKAEEAGRLHEIVHNGWIVDDSGDGGLQYDNGVCGLAVLELFRFKHEQKYLQGARLAADWAAAEPAVPNWNYNSFSVYLLAEFARETGEAKYLEAAVKKAQLGVYPGQLSHGENRGRWFDPHNAEITYHYILVRSLVALTAALKDNDSARKRATDALLLGLRAHDAEFSRKAIPDVESAFEALLLLQQYFPDSDRSIGEAQQTDALGAIAAYCVSKVREGTLPVAPGVWGRYLAYARAREGK
jgi:hypothetical protein